MVISPYRTQLTRMIQDGEKNPERNMTNRKAPSIRRKQNRKG